MIDNNNQPPYDPDLAMSGYGSRREKVEKSIATRAYNRRLQSQRRWAEQQAQQVSQDLSEGVPAMPELDEPIITSIGKQQDPINPISKPAPKAKQNTGFQLPSSLTSIQDSQKKFNENLTKPSRSSASTPTKLKPTKAVPQKTADVYKANKEAVSGFSTVPQLGANYDATKALMGQSMEAALKLLENPLNPDLSNLTEKDKKNISYNDYAYKKYYEALDPKATGLKKIYNTAKMNYMRAASMAQRTILGQVGRVLDVPDFLQSMAELPHQNTIKDWGYTVLSTLNDGLFGVQDVIDWGKSKITGNDKPSAMSIARDHVWRSNKEAIQKKAIANKLQMDELIKNGEYESSKNNFYKSNPFLSSLSTALTLGGKLGKAIDGDEGMDNWLSSSAEDSYLVGTEGMNRAYTDRIRPAQEAKFEKEKQKLIRNTTALAKEKGGKVDQEKLDRQIKNLRAKIINNDHIGSLFREEWDKDERNPITKGVEALFGGDPKDYLNYDGSAAAFAQHFTESIAQGAAQILTTTLLTRGLGAGASLVGRGVMATGRGVAATKAGVKTGELATKFSNRASNLATKVGQTKGFSAFTDKISSPLSNMYKGVIQQLQTGKVNPKYTPLGKAPKSSLGGQANFTAILAFDESQQIGIDVYNTSLAHNIEKKLGFTKDEFFARYTPADGENFTAEETAAMERDWENQIESLAKAEPEDFSKIVRKSVTAGQIAASTNFVPEFASTMLMFSKFGYFKPKQLTTRAGKKTLITGNNILTRNVWASAKEGFLEEGGTNMYSEKLGEAYGEDRAYSLLTDFVDKDFGSAENMENILKGMAGSISTTGAMEVFGGKLAQETQMLRNKLKFASDMKELSKYTGKNELSNFLKNSLQLENQAEFEARQKALVEQHQALQEDLKKATKKEDKTRIKKELKAIEQASYEEERALFSTQVNNAIHAGRVDTYIKSLETLAEKAMAENDVDALESLESMIAATKEMESVYVRHQNLKGSGKIITNRFNALARKQQLEDLDSQLGDIRPVEEVAIERQARIRARERAVSPRANAKTGMPKKGTFVQSMYDEIYDSVLEEVREQARLGNDLGEADLRTKNLIQAERAAAQKELDKLEMSYQELISEEYQEKYEDQIAYKQEVNRVLNSSKEEDVQNKLDKTRKKYKDTFTPAQLDAMENEIQTQFNNFKNLKELAAAKAAEDAARIEAERLKTAKKVVQDIDKEDVALKDPDEIIDVEKETKKENLSTKTRGIPPLSPSERMEKESELAELQARQARGESISPEYLQELEESLGDDNFKEQADNAFGSIEVENTVAKTEVQEETPSENTERDTSEDPENYPTETTPGDPIDIGKLAMLNELASLAPEEGTMRTPVTSLPYAAESENQETFIPLDTDDGEDIVYSPRRDSEAMSEGIAQKQRDAVDVAITRAAMKYGKSVTQITPQDVMQYFMEIQGLPFVQSKWDAIGDAYKALRPNEQVDFDKLYNNMFDDPVDLYNDAFGGTEIKQDEKPSTPVEKDKKEAPVTTNPVLGSATSEVTSEDDTDETLHGDEPTETGNPRVLKSGISLNLRHISTVFSKELAELNSHLVNFKKFFDYKYYQDNKSDSLDIEFSIPENYWDFHIHWNPSPNNTHKLNFPISFRKWENARKKGKKIYGAESLKKKMADEEWLKYVPIVGKDKDGNVVMVLNNGDYADAMDIFDFPVSMPQSEREKYKKFSNESNMKIRRAIAEGGNTPVKAKVKPNFIDRGDSSGTESLWELDEQGNPVVDDKGIIKKKTIKVEPRTLSTEPQSSFDEKRIMIGVYDPKLEPGKNFLVDGQPVEVENYNYTNLESKRNKTVIIRQIGVKEDGSPRYLAVSPDMVKVNRIHAQSMMAAIRSYLLKDNTLVTQSSVLEEFNKKNEGIFDFKSHNQLRSYILSFIQESSWSVKANADKLTDSAQMQKSFAAWLNGPNNARPGQVSVAFVNYKVIIATKPLDGSDIKEEDILVLDPRDFEDGKADPTKIAELIAQLGSVRDAMVANPNSLSRNKYTSAAKKKFYLYGVKAVRDANGEVQAEEFIEEYENYDEFSKSTIFIPNPIRSLMDPATNDFIHTREDGSQYTNNHRYYSLEVSAEPIDETPGQIEEKENQTIKEENTREELKEVAERTIESDTPNKEEAVQAKVDEVMKKIVTLEATKARFLAMGDSNTAAKLTKTILDLRSSLEVQEDSEDTAYSPTVVTDEDVSLMQELAKEDQNKIPGLTISQMNQMVDNLFHRIATSIGYKQGSKISKARILRDIKTLIFKDLDEAIETNKETISDLVSLGDPSFEPFIEAMFEKNKTLTAIKDNWEIIEGKVLGVLENKAGIKEVKDTTKKFIEDEQEGDPEDSEETNPDESDAIDDAGDVDEREKSFNSSALEVKGKLTGSAKMKRFLSGIPIMIKRGGIFVESTGYLGHTKFYSFEELDNLIKVGLNSPREIASDYKEVIKKLREIGEEEGKNWAIAVADKLENESSEQARIEFLYNYTGKHALSSKYVEFQQTRSGFVTKVNDANYTDIAKNIRLTWKNGVKTEGIIYDTNEEGDYIPDMDVVNRLIADFEAIVDMTATKSQIHKHGLNYIPKDYQQILRELAPGESVTIPRNAFTNLGFKNLSKVKTFPAKINYGKLTTVVTKDRDDNITFTRETINQNQVTALSNWLSEIGLDINASTLTDLVNNGFPLGRKGTLLFQDLVNPESLEGPFVNIYNNLKTIKNRQEVLGYPVDFESFSVLDNMNKRLDSLANIEAKYTNRVITKNFKDNGKLISGLPVGKFATDRVGDLKGEVGTDENGNPINVSPVRTKLLQTRFNRNSLLLNILDNPSEDLFIDIFGIKHIAVGSLKGKNSKFAFRAKVTQLSPRDLEILKLAHFHESNNVPKYSTQAIEGFTSEGDVRIANVFLPTMSDKDQMMALQTLLFNMAPSDLVNGQLSERFLNLLYSQIVKPELERMHDFHLRRKQGDTTISGYDKSAQLFNFVSSLNNFKVDGENNLTTMIKNQPEAFGVDTIEATYGPQIKKELNDLVISLVSEKREEWDSLNITGGKIKAINANYLGQKESAIGRNNEEEVLDNLAAEFIINNLITNANVHMMIVGDPALYSKNGPLNEKNFHTDANGKLDVTRPKDESKAYELYRDWAENGLGTNLGKRLALMLAPGNKIYNSKNEKFKLIFLEDSFDISDSLSDLVATQYGEEYREQIEDMMADIKLYNNELADKSKTDAERAAINLAKKEVVKEIQNKFPSIADYTKIEATDAQEYTTTREHLHMLRGQGRITDETYELILNKLDAQRRDLETLDRVDPKNYLTTEELQTVFQPFKPVYTGQQYDENEGVMRTVYNKTSSFPLIPQLTAGKAIDGLRVMMETYENGLRTAPRKPGETDFISGVRATHGSGAKVGSSTLSLSPFNSDGSFNKEDFTLGAIEKASLTLSRNELRIQQDVPYKSAKTKEDTIKYGTQMLKLLFSNGILDIEAQFDNPDSHMELAPKTISGRELFARFNEAFGGLVEVKKAQLYKELGLSSTGVGGNTIEFRKKVERLLQNEGKKRDYNPADLKSLKLNENGEFILPLYLNSQSSRIETLLLSIVVKRVLEHKLPGYTYVAASEAGFNFNEDVKLEVGADRVIYLDGFEETNGKLKARTKDNLAQIMVPSKFRDGKGQLLDLYQKDDKGQFKYLNIGKNNRYTLKPNMVDDILKSISTFRIPTSSHVSLSQVQIVGILPPEAGDLIIVPKDFTKQKGLDYDVDKENTYHLWTYVNKKGQIKEFSQDRMDYLVDQFTKRHAYKMQKLEQKNMEALAAELDENFEEELETTLGSAQEMKSFDELNETFEDKLENLKLRLRQKIEENRIVKIHSAVLGNQNPEIQKKITKVLSMDFATSQAEKISALKAIGDKTDFLSQFDIKTKEDAQEADAEYSKNFRHFSILSDAYQTKKMFLGSAGQSGIGVYSNFLTMVALMQQYSNKDTEFALIDPETRKILEFEIAGQNILAKFGSIRTIDGGRTISEVFEELQNTATDNEKEQIMGRTGINNSTIGVFSLMNALGIDKVPVSFEVASKYNIHDKDSLEDIDMSFGNLMLSQDVVTEFTARLDLKESSTTELDSSTAIDIIREMIGEMRSRNSNLPDFDSSEGPLNFSSLSGDNLVTGLAGELSPELQEIVDFEILHMMEMFMEYTDSVRSAQKVLSMSSNGLGLDLLEANNNTQILAEVLQDPRLYGFSNLLITPSEEETNNSVYIDRVGSVSPSTPLGHSLIGALEILKKTWSNFYPYMKEKSRYSAVVAHALASTTIKPTSQKKVEFERAFNKDLRRYLFALNNLYQGSDLTQEREEMFFDTPGGNESLASYLNRVLKDETLDEEIMKDLKNNPLIRKLTFDIHKNSSKNLKKRRPSVVKYDITNASQENEDALHGALIELIESNQVLSDRNGQPYTTRSLARDLILSAYLEGGVQEVHQYVKYIPLAYLQAMGFTNQMREVFSDLDGMLNIPKSPVSKKSLPNTFVRQFFQHNPKYVRELKDLDGIPYSDLKQDKEFDVVKDDEFTFSEETKIKGNFFTIKDPDIAENHRLALFERVPDTNTFRKIDTVGFFGMHEYDPRSERLTGMKKVKISDDFEKPAAKTKKAGPAKRVVKEENKTDLETFGVVDGGSIRTVVQNIMASSTTAREIIEPFSHMFSNNIKLAVVDSGKFNGSYNSRTNTVTIDQSVIDRGDPEFLANIIVKELVHAATKNQIEQYVNAQGQPKVAEKDIPVHVRRLLVLFNELRKEGVNLGVRVTKDGPTLEEFLTSYKPAGGIDQKTLDSFYGFTNINEFMEMALTEPKFREYMDKLAAMDKKRSFTERLRDALKSLLKAVALQGDKSVSQQVVDATLELIFQENKIYSKNPGPVITQEVKDEIASRLKDFVKPSATKHLPKEEEKARLATQYIGIGAPDSSTARYADLYEQYGLANTGVYHSNDVVWVSSNGRRKNRVSPINPETGNLSSEYKMLRFAMAAGATIVMDTEAHLASSGNYNVGEIALAKYLEKNGWVRDPNVTNVGLWTREGDTNYSPSVQTLEDINGMVDKLLRQNSINMETTLTEDPFKC